MPRISKDRLVRLQKTLVTDAAIGAKFKISRQAIHQLRKKYGLASVPGKNKERNSKILAAYKSGATGTDISEKFGLSVSQTYRILNAKPKHAKKAGKKTAKKRKK